MSYQEFLEYMKTGIQKMIGADVQADIMQVNRNNGVVLDGLIIRSEKKMLSPTIYLNLFYEQYQQGRSGTEILDEIYRIYQQYSCNTGIDPCVLSDYGKMKKYIVFKLVNIERNREYLPQVPYVKFLDMAVVFYALVPEDRDKLLEDATFQIREEHLKMWSVDVGDIYRDALYNCPELFPAQIFRMEDMLMAMLRESLSENKSEDEERSCEYGRIKEEMREIEEGIQIKMYVLTNSKKTNGAACLLYKDVLGSFARECKKDFYIIPSSIHEVLLVPAEEDVSKEELKDMVVEVNESELDEEEILSDNIYYYDRKNDMISLMI